MEDRAAVGRTESSAARDAPSADAQKAEPTAGPTQDQAPQAGDSPDGTADGAAGGRRPWLSFRRLGIRSLALRLVAVSAVLIVIGLTAGALALIAVYQDTVRRDFDRQLDALYGVVLGRMSREGDGKIVVADQDITIFQNRLSGNYWQIVHRGQAVAQSRSLGDEVFEVEIPPKGDDNFFYEIDGPFGNRLRVLARSVELKEGEPPLIILVAVDWSGQEASIEEFTLTIAIALGLLGLFLIAAVFLQIRFGLLPLRRVPPALADIRTGKADRLTGVFPTEVQPLATEINQLLDHNAQVVERARTHVGNLAHALKTPLAVLTNEAENRKSEMAGIVKTQTDVMREQVEHYLSRARVAARAGVLGARTSVMPLLEGLQRTLEKIYSARGIRIELSGPPDIAFRGERQDLEELLGNLMDNACKWATSRVRVTVSREPAPDPKDSDRLIVVVEDDGRGLTPSERRQAVKRGQRLDELTPGSGLGLSIVSDIADIYGGTFTLHEAGLGGLAAKLDLPVAGN